MNLGIKIQKSRGIYKFRRLTQSVMKQRVEVALAINNEKKCFKSVKSGYFKKECPEKDLKDNLNDNCQSC